jgi:WhiB family redox-sensing transcriptional regulator
MSGVRPIILRLTGLPRPSAVRRDAGHRRRSVGAVVAEEPTTPGAPAARAAASEPPFAWSDESPFTVGPPVSMPWTARAACRGANTAVFFATDEFSLAAARRLCRRCPVRRECAAYALARPDVTGVWGGLTDAERRALVHPAAQQPRAIS